MGKLGRKYVLLSERVVREGDGSFTGYCDELGLATCSDTEESTSLRLQQVIVAVLDAATKRDEILRLLGDRNVPLHDAGAAEAINGIEDEEGRSWCRTGPTFRIGGTTHAPYQPVGGAAGREPTDAAAEARVSSGDIR